MKQGDITLQDQAVMKPDVYVYFAQRTNTDAASSVGYTGIGFKPSAIIIFAEVSNTGAVSWTLSGYYSSGIYSTGNRNIEEETSGNFQGIATAISIVTGFGQESIGTMTSIDTDGFTINWTKAGSPTGTTNLRFMAFK